MDDEIVAEWNTTNKSPHMTIQTSGFGLVKSKPSE